MTAGSPHGAAWAGSGFTAPEGGVTAGQAAYEGFVAFQGDSDFQYETWQEKDETGDQDVMGRADWEAAGQAVIAAQDARPAPELAAPTGIDPASTAYRVHAHAFNTLTRMLAREPHIPLSVRDAAATAIVEAIEPIIRADERKRLEGE